MVTRLMMDNTEDGSFTTLLNEPLSSAIAGTTKLFSALNIFLSITASLGNVLILIALHKVTTIHPPTKLFFRCLAVTDLGVGILVQPLYAAIIMSPWFKINVHDAFYVVLVALTLSWCLCGVSILTSAAVSVDRLLTLFLGLRYRHVVTLRRVHGVIICFWTIGALSGWTRMQSINLAYKGTVVILTLCLVTVIFCYTMIHLKLRRQQAQLRVHNNVPQGPIAIGGEIPLNIARYKKTVSSILWVQLALVACYVPLYIVIVVSGNRTSYAALRATETLVYLNSSLNPILYCWKIREVKQAVRDILRQFYCF